MFGSGNARLSALRRFLAVVLCVAMVSSGVPSSAVAFALDEVQSDIEVPAEISDAGLSLQEDVDGEAAAEPVSEPESPVVEAATDDGHTEDAPAAEVSETVVTDVAQNVPEPEAETPSEEVSVEFEHVRIVFDANVAKGDEHPAIGTMEDFDFVLDGQPHGLPEMGFAREGFEFAGWSTTRDGRDVADDPATKADESMAAFGLAEGTPLVDLGYIEVIRDVDADGNVTNVREIPRNLADAKRDGVIILYAQWVPVEAEEAEVKEPAGEDVQKGETKPEEGDKTLSDSQEEAVVEIPDETGADTAGDAKQTEGEGTEVVSETPEQIGTRADLMSVLRSGDVALTGEMADDGADAPSVGPALLGGPLKAPSSTRTFAITFDPGEGTFEGGSSTNVINVSETKSDVTKVSHTPNVDDEGNKISNYSNNLKLNDVVTIDGAPELTVTISAGGQGTSYDWACVWSGAKPEYTAYSDWNSSVSGKLGGTRLVNRTYTIEGDSVTFGFRSDGWGAGSGTGGGYGYFASVSGVETIYSREGTYQIPTAPTGLRFAGWEDADGNLVSDWKGVTEDATLTARYADYKVSFDTNGGTGSMMEMSLGPGVVAPACLFVAPEGKAFGSWNTAADGSGRTYMIGDEIDYTGGNVTLYAQWDVPSAFAVLDADGNMTFFRAARSSQTGSNVSVVDIDGTVRTGTVWSVDENYTYSYSSSVPWISRVSDIKTVSFAHTIAPVSMAYWFSGCSNLSDFDSENLDTSNVTSMSYMFSGCSHEEFNPDLSGWNVSKVRSMASMFRGCKGSAFAPQIGTWSTPELRDMSDMFTNTIVSELDLSSFYFGGLYYISNALPYTLRRVTLGPGYSSVELPSGTGPNSSYGECWHNVTTGGDFVTAKQLLRNYQPMATSGDYAPGTYERQYRGHTYGVLTPDGDLVFVNGVTDPDTIEHCGANQTIVDTLGHSWTGTVFKDAETGRLPWAGNEYRLLAKRAYVAPGSVFVPSTLSGFFNGMRNLESIDFAGFDTHAVAYASAMCIDCTSLRQVDLSGLDFSQVTSMGSMFHSCTNLEYVNLAGIDTRRVYDMASLFMNARRLERIDGLSSLDTRSLVYMGSMFYGCKRLGSVDLSGWDVRNLRDMSSAFYDSGLSVNIDRWSAPNLTANNLGYALSGVVSVVGRNMRIGASVSDDNGFYLGGNSVLVSADFSGSTFHMTRHFQMNALYALKSLNLSGMTLPAAENFMCNANYELTDLNVSNLRLPNVRYLYNAFSYDKALTHVDLSSVYAPNVTHLRDMFSGCSSLSAVGLSGFDTSHVEAWEGMFTGCSSLTALDLSYLDTSSAKYMSSMFADCSNLATLDLSSWNTTNVEDGYMARMFTNCDSLQRLSLGEGFVFVGDVDSLPDPVWKRVETGEVVNDLWHDYDGAMMAGTYVRSMSTIDSDDVHNGGCLSDLTYDPETGEVVIYLKSPSHGVPSAVNVPALMGLLKVHKDVVGDSAQLVAAIDRALVEGGALPDLKVSVATVAYGDVTSCVYDDNALFTFDVSKDSTEHVKIELWRTPKGDHRYSYVGYLENSVEEPKVFRHYDADGVLIETLGANEQHTKDELYDVDVEQYPNYAKPFFPAYEEFVTYNPSMDNFEVKTAPGYYRMVVSTPDAASIEVSDVTKSEDDAYYQFALDGSSDGAYLTLFNSVDSVPYTPVTNGSVVLGRFRKVDTEVGNGVRGALYMFVGTSNGDVMYAYTDSDGYIYAYSGAYVSGNKTELWRSNMLYGHVAEDGTLSYTVQPVMDETYHVYEMKSPDGYYKNPTMAAVKFAGSVTDPVIGTTINVIRHDGVSITADEAVSGEYKCYTCGLGMGQCLCGLYRRDSCQNCGNPSASVHVTIANSQHRDQPYPQASVSKVDSLRKPLAGAHLQILDGSEVIDDWVSNGSLHAFSFGETGEHGIAYGERGRQFVLHEVATPGSGYKLAADIPFTVDWDSGVVQLRMIDDDIVDVSVDKEWYPSAPAGASCTFTLVVDGALSDKTITLDGTADETGESAPWVATFEDLPKYDARTFKAISYKVVETRTSLGWAPEVSEAVESGGTIRNMRTVELPATGLGGTPAEFAGCGLAIVATSLSALWLRRRRRGMAA